MNRGFYPRRMSDLFEFQDYKAYLRAAIKAMPNKGRGTRLALANKISCPASHVSQVLSGNSHFSMEQAEAVSGFLGHTDEEANFFLLLLQFSRAGTSALRKRLEKQLRQATQQRRFLKNRLDVKDSISPEDQGKFYSSWLYSAIHVIVSIEKFQTKDSISDHLGISAKRTAEILEFLLSLGLVVKANGRYSMGKARIHLGSDSPLISKLHTNWRMKAIQSLEKEDVANDLHYSSVVTISEQDSERIKSLLVKAITDAKETIKESKEEGIHCFSLDFFRI